MTREEFKKVLEEKGYSYKLEGDKIVVTHERYVNLSSLTSLPPGVEFKNRGYVNLSSFVGGWFIFWKGNIEGIKPNRLLNKMIELGLFNKGR